MQTNPVVVRRIMAGLRDRGYVRSEKGHGGGWQIACDFGAVTLRDIYDTGPSISAMCRSTWRTPESLLSRLM
jgi:DNA-binding IscR family transcriptional regulator